VLLAVPFSLVGAFALLHWLNYNLSIAVWVGIIALAGLDAETGVVMLLYLDLAYDQWIKKGQMRTVTDLCDAIYHGAVKRVRPKAMTACVIIAGLAPIASSSPRPTDGAAHFSEAGAWRDVGAGWQKLFGSFRGVGYSIEWHDFVAKREFDWAPSFV